MVLITSLAAPFFTSLVCVGLALARPLTEFLMPEAPAPALGEFAVDVFAWSALPATVAALGLTPFVLQRGTYSWLHAAVAGVLAFMAGAIIFPLPVQGALPFLAFLASLIAIGMRQLLITGGILLETPKT
jgi:hypothetical protein